MNGTVGPWQEQLRTVQVVDGAAGCAVSAHVASLARGLVARGVDVTVCAPVAAEHAFGFAKSGARFRTLEIGGRSGPRDDAAAVAVLRYVCSTADVVHAHGLRSSLLCALALRSIGPVYHRAPLVVTMHGPISPHVRGRRLLAMLERRAVRAADMVLGASSDLVSRARCMGAKDARLAPVAAPSSTDVRDVDDVRAKVRAELGVGERPLLLSVGRLSAGPSHRLLLDAARSWRDLEPQPLLLVVGDGPERSRLQERIDAERLPARLLGRRTDVPELLAACEVVVLPSRWEGRSLLAQLALRTGVPLAAFAVGAVPELVGEAAALVPYGDADALALTVADLLADPELRATLAERGRAQAATWPDEDDTVAQVLSIYDELALLP